MVPGCGKIRLTDLIEAYKVCKESNYKEGKDELVEQKTKLIHSKCVIITKCYECPHYSWTGEGICIRAGKNIEDKNEIAEFCPLSNFNEWEKVLWGRYS